MQQSQFYTYYKDAQPLLYRVQKGPINNKLGAVISDHIKVFTSLEDALFWAATTVLERHTMMQRDDPVRHDMHLVPALESGQLIEALAHWNTWCAAVDPETGKVRPERQAWALHVSFQKVHSLRGTKEETWTRYMDSFRKKGLTSSSSTSG
jgi:hypothetical protein